MTQARLLLVDDDPLILKTIAPELLALGYHVTTAKNGEEAVSLLESGPFDLVLTDLVMDKIDGIGVLKKAKEKDPDMSVIILTGYGNLATAIAALRLSADDYLLKPCEPRELRFRVARSLEKTSWKRRLKDYEKILPVCPECRKIRDDTGANPGQGEWVSLERFLWKRGRIAPSSTYCPQCFEIFQRQMDEEMGKDK